MIHLERLLPISIVVSYFPRFLEKGTMKRLNNKTSVNEDNEVVRICQITEYVGQ